MTSMLRHARRALVALGMLQVGASAASQYVPPATTATIPDASLQRAQVFRAPTYLQNRVRELGSGFNGRVGISVKSVNDGWSVGWKADELYPQQSVSKLWVAITALDRTEAMPKAVPDAAASSTARIRGPQRHAARQRATTPPSVTRAR